MLAAWHVCSRVQRAVTSPMLGLLKLRAAAACAAATAEAMAPMPSVTVARIDPRSCVLCRRHTRRCRRARRRSWMRCSWRRCAPWASRARTPSTLSRPQTAQARMLGCRLLLVPYEAVFALEVFSHFSPMILSGFCTFWKSLPINSQNKKPFNHQNYRANITQDTSANAP